ncbi:adenosine deaminase/editase [Dendryphion nanum]|uniref:acylphosphatase n=1 Tax=Dendryphion nanum TaxID=256645 RepID=A0A9P9EFI5_9PLEO|nr:adenosine deaminase/editase [Dendryphion nanum]
MKCLPSTKLPQANGTTLHDWHAEILALRAFNRFLLDECLSTLTPPYQPSQFVTPRLTSEITPTEPQSFRLSNNVQIHMYSSEAPCGDASMELTMSAQEDATPWTSAPPSISSSNLIITTMDTQKPSPTALRGRSHFSHLGAVRLKPSRPDAPPTLSKSCTDKLAASQSASLLSSLPSLLLSPRKIYLSSLVLPESQYVEEACVRAFSRYGRLAGITEEVQKGWMGGYAFTPFEVKTTKREFGFSRRCAGVQKLIPCNISAVYTPHFQETLIGGVLQGRKQFDPRGASRLCRNGMWKAVMQVAGLVVGAEGLGSLRGRSYGEVKRGKGLEWRRRVKEDVRGRGLVGWVRNEGDEEWGI